MRTPKERGKQETNSIQIDCSATEKEFRSHAKKQACCVKLCPSAKSNPSRGRKEEKEEKMVRTKWKKEEEEEEEEESKTPMR